MNKHLISLLAGLFSLSGITVAQMFTIEGKIDGAKSGKAELQLRESGKYVTKYSTGIGQDGSLAFKGKVLEPDMYLLKLQDVRGGIQLFLDNSTIVITGSSDNLSAAEINGSSTHDVYKNYTALMKAGSEKMRPVYEAYNKADEEKNEAEKKKLDTRLETARAEQLATQMNFIRENARSPVAAYLLNSIAYNVEDPAQMEQAINAFPSGLAGYKYVKSLKDTYEKMKVTAVGVVAPDFVQNDPEGKPVKLSDFRGKYLLVDFWASWCGPCRAENPNVVKAYNKYKGKGFTILGVSLDRERDPWLKAILDDKLTWTHVSDVRYWDNEVAKQYGIRAIPANVLLDKNGRIVGKNLRGDKLEQALAKLVK
jgi:thiol-disulfide isomerase/thioredoxin